MSKEEKSLVVNRAPSLPVVSDPLSIYLREIGRIPLLTTEQEQELALRLFREQDLEAAKKLVNANLRLVVKIALEYRQTYQNVLDLIQEGNIGLMKGVSKFDPHKGVRLSTYVGFWIRSYILKFILDNFRLVRVSTTKAQKKLFYNLLREKEKLELQGISAQPKLLADKLSVPEEDVKEMEMRLLEGEDVSTDQPVGFYDGGKGRTLGEQLSEQDAQTPEVVSERSDLLRRLDRVLPRVLPSLSAREKQVLEKRIMAEEPLTLQELAQEFGMSRERVRQIENEILQKIRVAFQAKES